MMEELGDETSDRTSSLGGTGTTLGATAGRIGEFLLLREVGRGGMGVVYEAEQESLGRRVALKVLPSGALTDTKQIRRFEREARSAARLHHTNIVPIFGVGETDGTHYYVMQFIQGQGLDAVLHELKKLRDARETRASSTASRERPVKGRNVAADIAQSLVTGRFGVGTGGVALSPEGTATAAWSDAPHYSPASAAPSEASVVGSSSTSAVSTLSETDRRFAQAVARIGVQVAEALAHAHGAGHSPPRYQAVELAAGSRRQCLGDRLRAGQGGRWRGLDAYRRYRRHGAGTWRPSDFRVPATRGRTFMHWG